jgi:CubicO group peptidase (beta-lactamase class C family)
VNEAEALGRALRAIDEWIGQQGPSGVAAAVWRPDRIVAEHAAGEARPGVPARPDVIFPLASVTKPITATTVMTLVEDGSLSLDEPVYRWVPEFRTAAAEDGVQPNPELERLRPTITARQLLSHVSGLPEDLGPRPERHAEPETLEAIVDRFCRLPLLSEPGRELRYSNAGYGIAARLAERVSGREFWALTEARVLEPLGLRDTVVRPDATLLPRFALLGDAAHAGTPTEAYNSDYWRQLAIPWGGAYGTSRDLARFAGAFLARGPRLLSAAGVRAMTTDQTEGVPGGVESAKAWWPSGRWGLGWEVKGPKRRHWTGELTSPATFCHFGAAGTLVWADPERDVALAVFANRMVARMWNFILPRWARLSNAIVAAVS